MLGLLSSKFPLNIVDSGIGSNLLDVCVRGLENEFSATGPKMLILEGIIKCMTAALAGRTSDLHCATAFANKCT